MESNARFRHVAYVATCFVLLTVFLSPAKGYSQQNILGEPTGRYGEPPQVVPKEEKEYRVPVPPIQPPSIPAPSREGLPGIRAFIREIRVTGNTVFSPAELSKITVPYTNRTLTSEDLDSLRNALTLLYVNNGYVNSGAVLPDQTVKDGVITIQIIEGRLERVNVEDTNFFRPSYISRRIELGSGPPLNIYKLQERLQFLQQDERIERIEAELKPGIKRGEALLDVKVKENSPYRFWLDVNNYQPPTVGSVLTSATIAHQNFSGNGDIFSFSYGESRGIEPKIVALYSLPLTARDLTASLEYRKNDFSIVEDPFRDLNITSKFNLFGITFRQPLYRTLNNEFALSLTGEYLHNETYLDGEPFSFSPGTHDGKSTVTALRLAQEWVYRTRTQVVALRSRFSFGIDAMDATKNSGGVPDGRFLAWLLETQWLRRYKAWDWDFETVGRLDVQLTTDSLLPMEQMSVGGRYSVRGYRECTLVRDQVVIASLEARIPIMKSKPWADALQLAPFVDYGYGWNRELPTAGPKSLSSVGIGLRWEATIKSFVHFKPVAEIYWGVPLHRLHRQGSDLQDDGIHFRFVLMAY